MYELQKTGRYLRVNLLGLDPRLMKKRIYHSAVSQILRYTGLRHKCIWIVQIHTYALWPSTLHSAKSSPLWPSCSWYHERHLVPIDGIWETFWTMWRMVTILSLHGIEPIHLRVHVIAWSLGSCCSVFWFSRKYCASHSVSSTTQSGRVLVW